MQNCRNYGKCRCCGRQGKLTRNHVKPIRFFKGKGEIVLVCRHCHDEIEREIPRYEQMPLEFYEEILFKFGVFQ